MRFLMSVFDKQLLKLFKHEPRIYDFTFHLVFTYKNAATGILCCIACVYKYPLKMRDIQKPWELPPKSWRPVIDNLIGTKWYGSLAVYFLFFGQVSVYILQCITEVLPINIEFSYGVLFSKEYPFQCQFHSSIVINLVSTIWISWFSFFRLYLFSTLLSHLNRNSLFQKLGSLQSFFW